MSFLTNIDQFAGLHPAVVNNIIVGLKIAVVIIFIILGWRYINNNNYNPYIPVNTGTFGKFGFSGIIRAATIVFFAYIGFDSVSTAAQEAKNPKRDMPWGILGSLAVCTILYILFAHVLTGVTNYATFVGKDGIAPVALAIEKMGTTDKAGIIHPDYPWLNRAIIVAILAGYSSVVLVMLMGQSRVFLSMSRDGLIPKIFSQINPATHTPVKKQFIVYAFRKPFRSFCTGPGRRGNDIYRNTFRIYIGLYGHLDFAEENARTASCL